MTWNRTFRTLSAQQGLSLVDNARFFAVLYMTATDALISVWDDKAHWSFWRPITAIREAGTDGNPRTEPDPGWLPLIPTPPYPEHPSGHTGFSGSIVKTLQQFFGTDRIGVERHERGRHARVHPLLPGDRRRRRRPGVVRDPLPDRGRAG